MDAKYNDETFQQKALQHLACAKTPISVGYLSQKMNIGWNTARAILTDLVLQGKVTRENSNAKVFSLKNGGKSNNESRIKS